jgi:hypothetical protein
MPSEPQRNWLPEPPRLVLRVGFAGNRRLPTDVSGEHLTEALTEIFRALAEPLVAIAQDTGSSGCAQPRFSRFYSRQPPLLRLVTGLAEGADAFAARALDRMQEPQAVDSPVKTELAGVLPFNLASYRDSRTVEFRSEFDEHAARCSYILTLDGVYDRPVPDTDAARRRRARAYRAQSAVLLRQCDLLVAVMNPEEVGQAGGTLETVSSALTFDLPVILVDARSRRLRLLEPKQRFAAALEEDAAELRDRRTAVHELVTSILGDSDAASGAETEPNGHHGHGERLLEEFFHGANPPSLAATADGKAKRQTSLRERCWSSFEKRFRPRDLPEPRPDTRLEPYATWRSRATALNYHYSGLYRGAFLLNYALAVCAVTLAALSLVLLGFAGSSGSGAHMSTPLLAALIILGGMKLWIVIWIYDNTHQANHGGWNDKAVDYRYLAERLRAMFYLPRIGSMRAPAAFPARYASRVVRQSAVDWLFDVITRSIAFDQIDLARKERVRANNGGIYEATIVCLDPARLLEDVRDSWIREQAVYHDRTARTMGALHTFVAKWGGWLSRGVIWIVVADIVILASDLLHLLPMWAAATMHGFTPWLMFLAALLPAAVAGLNGIRFQSECRRLAERSAVIRTILRGRDRSDGVRGGRWAEADRLAAEIARARIRPDTDPAAWAADVLDLTERVAGDFVQEVGEWSALYAKEVPEP